MTGGIPIPVHNADIVRVFDRVADLLEVQDANPFRVRAYRNAARTVGNQSQSVADMAERGDDLTDLPGIGEDIADKIREIARTGSLEQLEALEDEGPAGLPDLLKVPGLGPKSAQKLHEELDVSDLDDLKQAAESGDVQGLEGFGEKTQQKILEGIERLEKRASDRRRLDEVAEYATTLLEHIRDTDGVSQAEVAGSYRRKRPTVGDLDILVTCEDPDRVMERFTGYDEVDRVVEEGKTRSTVVLRSGLQVDLRVVEEESYGAALLYFTGSKDHNIALRNRAIERDLKVNEYGMFEGDEDGERVAGATEEGMYEALDLAYVSPELREDRGEVAAAESDELPDLVCEDDIRGDLHAHTDATDGRETLEEMAQAALDRGYDYVGISDHSKNVTVAGGLDADGVRRQGEAIDDLNEKLDGIRVLKSIEVDILKDGSLDLPHDVLMELDLAICSVHTYLDLPRKEQTERLIRAMDCPHVHVLGHPTGRLIQERDPYDVDLDRVLEAAKERGCHLELNASPERLDLSDIHCRAARDAGVKVAINTDAHSRGELAHMAIGVGQARRGWLEKKDVLNTRTWKQLTRLLKRT